MSTEFIRAAYGRTYATPEAAIKDWNDGKDFQIVDGPYTSIRDVEKFPNYGVTGLIFVDSIPSFSLWKE